MDKENTVLYDLLIESCRQTPDTELLETYAGRMDDWVGFLDSAYVHGAFPLVHKSLKSIVTVPDKIKLRLKSSNLEIARRNMTMTAELLKIMRELEKNSVIAIAFKGPVLSQIIHGDVTQRQYADLDILVSQNDTYKAGQVLLDLGYTTEYSIDFFKNKMLLGLEKDVVFIKNGQHIEVELHWKLLEKEFISDINKMVFDSGSIEFGINNQDFKTLDHDLLLFYLLLHGSKHVWERLEWIVDIDRLIRLRSDVQWEWMLSTAKGLNVENLFYLGLTVCNELFGTKIPHDVENLYRDNPKIIWAKEQVLQDLFCNTLIETDKRLTTRKNLFEDDRPMSVIRRKIKDSYTTFCKVNKEDVYTINLPTLLFPLYSLIHPIRQFVGVFRKKD